jgi:hypothetical protein
LLLVLGVADIYRRLVVAREAGTRTPSPMACRFRSGIIVERVRMGRFPTPEAVVEAAVVELTETPIDESLDAADIAAIDEAEAQIDRGEGIDLAALRDDMSTRFIRPGSIGTD